MVDDIKTGGEGQGEKEKVDKCDGHFVIKL